jgi:hypothetical protein
MTGGKGMEGENRKKSFAQEIKLMHVQNCHSQVT